MVFDLLYMCGFLFGLLLVLSLSLPPVFVLLFADWVIKVTSFNWVWDQLGDKFLVPSPGSLSPQAPFCFDLLDYVF